MTKDHIVEIMGSQCGNFKNFPPRLLAKIPSKYFFTKELYCKLISRKIFEVGVNFRNFHTVGIILPPFFRKNSVKVTFYEKKLHGSEFLVFPHSVEITEIIFHTF